MAIQDSFFSSIGSIPYDDAVTPYAFDTTGRARVQTAPVSSSDVMRLGDITGAVLGAASPLSVATTAVVGTAAKASREDHIHPGVDLGNAQTITARKTFQTDLLSPLILGSIASGGSLTLKSTEHATKGLIAFGTSAYDEVNNRLGIGTAAPAVGLAVDPSGSTAVFAGAIAQFGRASTDAYITLNLSAGNKWMFGADGFGYMIYDVTAAQYRVVIDTAGKIGVGVTSPTNALELGGTGARRFAVTGGTATATTDWALTSGWGAGATISAVTGNDVRGTVTVTTDVLDTPTLNPVITLTFKNGTWTTAPFAISNINNNGTGPMGAASSKTTATTLVLTFIGTPTALSSLTYIFNYWVLG